MQIVVCIKQVPDTNNVKWSRENNLLREGMISILNPCDDFAIKRALEIKKKFKNAKVCAISMGPMQAKSVLEYALACGCDRAILLCDKAFAGSDTLCTGKILSQAIKKLVPDYNLIICGQFAQDGDTAQTGPTIAGFLDIAVASFVDEIINSDIKLSILKQKTKDGINILEVKNPCLVCTLKGDEAKNRLYVKDYVRAQDIKIEIYGAKEIDLQQNETGISGSPTFVSKAFRLEHNRQTKTIEKNPLDFLSDILEKEGNFAK